MLGKYEVQVSWNIYLNKLNNLKSTSLKTMFFRSRKTDTQVRHNMRLTGGGPPEKDTSNVPDDMVRAIVPTINYTLTNPWDSTGILEVLKFRINNILKVENVL